MGGIRTPGQRAGLTREAVLEKAYEMLVEEGLDGLTTRGLASRLGVAPNALYSYVSNKSALVDALLDRLLGEIDAPTVDIAATGTSPHTGLSKIMTETYRLLLNHADLVPLYLARQGARGPHAQRLGEVMLAFLGRAGVTGQRAHEARRVLIVYTIGFAALAASASTDSEADVSLPPRVLSQNFETGLGWLLDGMLRDVHGPAGAHAHGID